MNDTNQNNRGIRMGLMVFLITVAIFFIQEYIFSYKTELYIRDILNNPEYEVDYERYDSLLRYELIDENQCSDHWRFSKIDIRQSHNEPNEKNNFMFEHISKDILGSYDDYKISLRQWISIHQPDIDMYPIYEQTVESYQLSINQQDVDYKLWFILEEAGLFVVCSSKLHSSVNPYVICNINHVEGVIMEQIEVSVSATDLSEDTVESMINEIVYLIR